MAPSYKLTYFDVTGLAEPIRFLFSYGGIEFEDIRISRDKWPELKQSMPFGQIPILEHNGFVANQSIAIARYVGKQVKLAGDNDWENLQIDAIVDTITDFRIKFSRYHYETDEKVKQSLKETFYNETLPFTIGRLENLAQKNGGYLALSRLSWADVYFVGFLEYVNANAKMDIIANYPQLINLRKNILNNPNIKAYLEKRPKTAL